MDYIAIGVVAGVALLLFLLVSQSWALRNRVIVAALDMSSLSNTASSSPSQATVVTNRQQATAAVRYHHAVHLEAWTNTDGSAPKSPDTVTCGCPADQQPQATDHMGALGEETSGADASLPSWTWWLFGASFWDPDALVTRCQGELFTSYKALWFHRVLSVRMASGIVTAILLEFPVLTSLECPTIFYLLAAWSFFLALLFAATRPFRRPIDTCMTVVIHFLGGLIALNRSLLFSSKSTLTTVLVAIAVAGGILSVVLSVFEEVARRRRNLLR